MSDEKMKSFRKMDLLVAIILGLPFLSFIGYIGNITLPLFTYIVSAILSSLYFKKTGRDWWYGLFSPIIGGFAVAISSYILVYIYMRISPGGIVFM